MKTLIISIAIGLFSTSVIASQYIEVDSWCDPTYCCNPTKIE